jgi:hypothetical protein
MSEKEKLQESIEFFDEFVNAALCKEADKYPALEVVRHYNIVKNELAKHLAAQES